MKCECGAKMCLGSKGWECSNPKCGKIEEAVLIPIKAIDEVVEAIRKLK